MKEVVFTAAQSVIVPRQKSKRGQVFWNLPLNKPIHKERLTRFGLSLEDINWCLYRLRKEFGLVRKTSRETFQLTGLGKIIRKQVNNIFYISAAISNKLDIVAEYLAVCEKPIPEMKNLFIEWTAGIVYNCSKKVHPFLNKYCNYSFEDIKQEVIAHLLERIIKYNPEKGKGSTYVTTIAQHFVLGILVKAKAQKKIARDKDGKILRDMKISEMPENFTEMIPYSRNDYSISIKESFKILGEKDRELLMLILNSDEIKKLSRISFNKVCKKLTEITSLNSIDIARRMNDNIFPSLKEAGII